MPKYFLSLLFIISIHFCDGQSVNYSSFQSIEDVIEFETSCISSAISPEEFLEAYASRAESMLLCGFYEKALDDLEKANYFIEMIDDEELSQAGSFRVLFDQAIVYANLDNEEMVFSIISALKEMMDVNYCDDCVKTTSFWSQRSNPYSTEPSNKNNIQETQLCFRRAGSSGFDRAKNRFLGHHRHSILRCSDNTPIYGPDQISIKDCVDFVNNTITLSKLLISKATPSVRGLLNLTIDQLGDQARNCCRSGKGWKGCVQNLADKYHQWNQKWQVFGIPPNSAWD